jgi:hypothetical protein
MVNYTKEAADNYIVNYADRLTNNINNNQYSIIKTKIVQT